MHIFGIVISNKIYMPILIIIISVIIDVVCQKLLKRKIVKKHKHTKATEKKLATIKSVISNVLTYVIFIIAVLAILRVYGINATAIATGVGVASLVLGLAFQDILKDILAGFSIIFDNQFSVGDFVQIGTFKGTVTSLGIKTTRIQAYTGEVKIISNRNISEVTNYSIEHNLAVVDLSVSYESNLDKVERILEVAALTLKDKIPELVDEPQVLGVQELSDSSVIFRIIGKCKVGSYLDIERVQRIMRKELKTSMDKNNIKIPYPQIEVHNEK